MGWVWVKIIRLMVHQGYSSVKLAFFLSFLPARAWCEQQDCWCSSMLLSDVCWTPAVSATLLLLFHADDNTVKMATRCSYYCENSFDLVVLEEVLGYPQGSTDHTLRTTALKLATSNRNNRTGQILRLTVPSHLYWILLFLSQNTKGEHSLFKVTQMMQM